MFEFVSGKKYVSRRFEAADNDGGGVFADSMSGWASGFREVWDDPDLHEQGEGVENLGETVAGGQHLCDDGEEGADGDHDSSVD